MPGPVPLKASVLSPLGAVLGQPDAGREGGQEALQGVNPTTPSSPSGSLRPWVLRQGWKELNPSHAHHPSPRASLHPFQVQTLRPRPRADQLPLPHVAKQNETKQCRCLIEKSERNWKSTHCGKMWRLALPSAQPH